ncbi:MAG TPA: twin-arginine translocation signal domain-containing protein [Pirellulales bacterium]|nr:twin-arginine translocation signal domain-containing protein [Pirellulales bacterium]
MSDKYLFPHRLSRRDFLAGSAAAGAALALGPGAESRAAESSTPVKIGSGRWTYTLDDGWGKLPEGMKYGFGCAIVVDSKDRIFVTSRSAQPCVAVFDRDGKLLETWSNDFAEKVGITADDVAKTAHGLYWSREGSDEFFYFTENKPGNRVYKTDLTGKVLYELGSVAKEGSAAQKFQFDNPTDVAVAPNGDIYIVDGYGSQLVHRFDKNFKHLKTIGGRGKTHGLFSVCHGVWVNTLGKEPEVYIADRANNRIEIYSTDLEYRRTVEDMRLPCCFYQHDGHLYVPELGARVSILDAKDRVVAHLGDGHGIKKENVTPEKFATPHALTVDSRGDLYVVEWLDYGRVRKFRHTPEA